MSIISLQYQHCKPSQVSLIGDLYSPATEIDLPPIPLSSNNRFIQTHEIWARDDSQPKHQIKYNTSQLTDSLVCVSMSNEIRRTIASLTQGTKHAARPDPPPQPGLKLTGTTKLFGKSLFTIGAYKKAMSQPGGTGQRRYTYRNPGCLSASATQRPLELDLRLSPVNFKKGNKADVTETVEQTLPVKKEPDFRLPYRECLTKSKSPTIQVLEVECLICGQLGSVYRHRADKANCGRCGSNLAIKLDNKMEYKFKITNQLSGHEVRERLKRHGARSMRKY